VIEGIEQPRISGSSRRPEAAARAAIFSAKSPCGSMSAKPRLAKLLREFDQGIWGG
jgi:hypothetical protein